MENANKLLAFLLYMLYYMLGWEGGKASLLNEATSLVYDHHLITTLSLLPSFPLLIPHTPSSKRFMTIRRSFAARANLSVLCSSKRYREFYVLKIGKGR